MYSLYNEKILIVAVVIQKAGKLECIGSLTE